VQSPARDPEIPRLHADYVRRLARSLVFDDALADDVAQDVWVAALEHGPRESGSLRAWLATLARNLAWKSRRGERRRAAREESAARPEAVPSAAEILERESVRRGVIEVVLALEEPYRATIVLRYFEDLAPREVARRLEIPIETVRTREKRAREMLRARLDREHGDDRRAWSLALVRELRLSPPAHVWPIVAGSIVSGGFVMSIVKIVAGVSAGVLLVLGVLTWLEHPRVLVRSSASGSPAPAARLERAPDTDHTSAESARAAVESSGDERSTAAADASGSLRVRVLWGEDRTPAADVGVRIYPADGTGEFDWTDVRTDADGVGALDGLRQGPYSVNPDRPTGEPADWSGEGVDVVAGKLAEIEIVLAPGIAVEGEVVDAQGKPVSEAEIFLAPDQTGWSGHRVARSDAGGRFRIRAAPPDGYLSAQLSGRAPSLRPKIKGSVGSEVQVRLVFAEPGGELEGVVTDPKGAPVRGAKVFVGGEDFGNLRLLAGETVLGSSSRVADTDERGHFRIDGISVGSAPIVVRTRSFAMWKSTAEITAGGTTHIEVRLADPVIVLGTVRDDSGQPVPHASVILDDDDWLAQVTCTSEESGSFRLAGLPLGELQLKAWSWKLGAAETKVTGVPGMTLRWDPVLSSGIVISGRVLAPKEILGQIYVDAKPTRDGDETQDRVGTDGTFRLMQLSDQPYDLTVIQRSGSLPLGHLRGVEAGRTDVAIEIDPASLPSARIRGRLLGPSGDPVGDAEVFLMKGEGERFWAPQRILTDRESGRFESALLTPGSWALSITTTGLVHRSISTHSVAAGETWDIGDIVLSAGGVLVVTAKMEDGSDPPVNPKLPPFLYVMSRPPSVGEPLTPVGGVSRSSPLPPGPYSLRIASNLEPPIASTLIPFEIAVGQETHLDVVLRSGRKITISIRDPSPTPTAMPVHVNLDALDGTNLSAWGVEAPRDGRYESDVRLFDGEFRVEATARDGRKAEGTISVVPGGPDRFELELKKP
jgi:RNA polymerase sigma-70 factor (ECF subfamily)